MRVSHEGLQSIAVVLEGANVLLVLVVVDVVVLVVDGASHQLDDRELGEERLELSERLLFDDQVSHGYL